MHITHIPTQHPHLSIVRTNPLSHETPGPPAPTAPSQATTTGPTPLPTAAAPARRPSSRPATRRKVRVGLHSPDLLKTRWGKWRRHPPSSFEATLTAYQRAQHSIAALRNLETRYRREATTGPNARAWQLLDGGDPLALAPSNRASTYSDHRREFHRLRALGLSHRAAASRSGHWPHRAGDDGRCPYA